MAINYPLILPGTPGFMRTELRLRQILSRTEAPTSLVEQVYEWPGERWEAEVTLPPMQDRPTIGQWEAFFAAQRGGTFVMGDRLNRVLMGIGAAAGEFPTVDGAGQTGKTLATRGWGATRTGILKRGEALQIAKNYLAAPRAMDNAAWVVNEATKSGADTQADPAGGTTAERITPSGGATDASIGQTPAVLPPDIGGRPFVFYVALRAASGTPSISIHIRGSAGAVRGAQACALTTSWQWFSVSATMAAADTTISVYVGSGSTWVVAEGAVDVWGAALYSLQLDARLHRFAGTADVNSDGSGKTTLDLAPRLREATADFSALITASPVGTWRMAPGFVPSRSLDAALIAGMGFSAVEAIKLS